MEDGEKLYRRFLAGEKSAFDEIILMYRNSLEVFINSYVHNIYAAEDLAADTFVYVLTHKNQYNFSISIKSYLYMIGRSRAIDYLRRAKRHTMESLDVCTEADLEADTMSVQDMVINDERSKMIHDALMELPEDMRTVVYLVYFEELSYKEIAKIMKISTKKVDNLNYRGKAKLKEILGKESELRD